MSAALRLAREIEARDIQIVHAHGTSLFICALAGWLAPATRLIWHDHFGRCATEERPAWIYRLAARRASAVISVNGTLAQWARERLRVPARRVWYAPNFVCEPPAQGSLPDLPGKAGSRIVCVANLRPEKDHLNLISAMRLVAREIPQAHLILVGGARDGAYRRRVENAIAGAPLTVSWLGPRNDVSAILKTCDVGVLSSASEGLPLALLDYGMAGLPVVATRVGQCADVLENGRFGTLVAPFDSAALAGAIVGLLKSPAQREALSQSFSQRVREAYSAGAVMARICEIYETVLAPERAPLSRGEAAEPRVS